MKHMMDALREVRDAPQNASVPSAEFEELKAQVAELMKQNAELKSAKTEATAGLVGSPN